MNSFIRSFLLNLIIGSLSVSYSHASESLKPSVLECIGAIRTFSQNQNGFCRTERTGQGS